MIILCSPSNPTGGVLSEDELRGHRRRDPRALRSRGAGLRRRDLRAHPVRRRRASHSIASEEGMEARTVLASGHSKRLRDDRLAARLGGAADAEEAKIFKQLNINIVSCVPPFVQEAGREAYENPESQRVVDAMVAAVRTSPRLGGAGAQRRPGRPLSEPEGRLLRVPEHRRRLRVAGRSSRRTPRWLPRRGSPHQPVRHVPDVPALPLRRRHHGSQLVRLDRRRGSALPAAVDRHQHGQAAARASAGSSARTAVDRDGFARRSSRRRNCGDDRQARIRDPPDSRRRDEDPRGRGRADHGLSDPTKTPG